MPENTGGDNDPRNGERSRDEAELIGRVIQSEQKLSDYFTTIITKSVTDQLDARNMVRLRFIGLVSVALMTLAIPALMSWVRGTIVEQTQNAASSQFDTASASLETRLQKFLDQERMYSSFTNYLLYVSDRRSVPQSELTAVRLRLQELARHSSILDRAEFPYLLDLITRLAVKHDDKATLDLLESDFASQLTSPRTMPRLARYYGERAIGDRFTSSSKRDAVARRFQQYLDAAELSPDFETLLPLQLMVAQQLDNGSVEDVFGGIRYHVKDLDPQRQASFIAASVRYSNPQFWEVATTARTRRIASVAGRSVIDRRHFYIDLLDSVAVQTSLIDIAESEANDGNIGFATALTGFRNAFSGELSNTDDEEFRAQISALVRDDITHWIDNDLIVEALRKQNRETDGYSTQRIQELELQWSQEFESGAYDLIEGVQERAISRLLRRLKRDSEGMYKEIFVMDSKGLLVGASDPNNDYWQGDEEKWQQSYQTGLGSIHIGALKFDESALAWVIQISMPIRDPESLKPIGAVTIGVDPSMLEHSN